MKKLRQIRYIFAIVSILTAIALVVFVMDFCFQNVMEFIYPH